MWIDSCKKLHELTLLHIRFAQKQSEIMSITRLQEDLLNDFKEQKHIIVEQIELFDPLATSLRKPAAQRLASKGGLILAEIVLYLSFAGMVYSTIFLNLIYPFTSLMKVRYVKSVDDLTAMREAEFFSIAIHAMAGTIALLLLLMARMVRRIRLKNNILSLAGRNMKILVGQHLKRKAAIEAIEQRHMLDYPSYGGKVSMSELPEIGHASLTDFR